MKNTQKRKTKKKPSNGITPRPYLSWSQLILFEKDPGRYIQRYFEGQRGGTNRGQALGKRLALSLEHDEADGDPILDLVASQLPKLDIPEAEVRAEFKYEGTRVPLLAKLDDAAFDYSEFIETKTGPVGSWNQKKAMEGQTLFYSTTIFCATKQFPIGTLVHVVTKYDEQGRPAPTGDIRKFRFKHTRMDILKMQLRMYKAWIGIQELTAKQVL